jgi:type IV pilus biogenesis/stability protein PilW
MVPSICIFLAAIVWVVFGQTLGFNFVNYDDPVYVYANPVVQKGLTWEGFRWALTYGAIGHWHPLTWLSHMLDCQFYGLNAGGPHLTNVLLHTATVILLFMVLRRMTGCLWRSAFVVAVFAIHPLRVESVVWVAERKDVLSAFFFMLTLGAYVRYVRHPPSIIRYGIVVLFFALGLLSKDMLVTLPFVLLLLDYWPLNRLSGFSPQVLLRRVAEKIPLLVLTVGSCVVTFLMPENISSYVHLPLGLRLENAVVSYVTYLWQMIYPSGLACLYPNPTNYLPLWQVAGALGLLLAISGVVWAFYKQHPWLVVGWLWYLGMMIPVIGIVQISYYAHADRYTYLPQIGLYLLLTWAVADLGAGWRYRRVVLASLSTLILAALIGCARTQVSYWRNGETLWTHTLACTSDNFVGYYNLGNALLQKGQVDEAITQYQRALQIHPDYADAHHNLGTALIKEGKVDEAITQFQRALQIHPDDGEARYNLGNALLQKGQVDEAITQYQWALQIHPDNADAQNNLGVALRQKGKVDEEIAHYQMALQINPDNADAQNNLGVALLQKGEVDEAITQFQRALQINPDSAKACINLGDALRQKGQVDAAITQYQRALQIHPDNADAQNSLGSVLLQKGQVDEAIAHFQKALQIHPDSVKACINLGNALLQKGNVNEAIAHYQKALQINPDSAEVHINLGDALFQKGDMGEAIAHFQKALQIHPDNPEVQNNLGILLAKQGQIPEAIEHYQKAIELNPDCAECYNNLGNLLATQGRPDEAIGQFQQALAIEPDYAKAHYNLANIFFAQGRWDEAIEQYQRALKQMPDSVHAHYQLGLALQSRGRFAGTVAQLQKVLELDPKHIPAQNNLAWLLATCPDGSLRDGKKAVALAQQAVQLSGGNAPEILDTLAAAYAEAGSFPEAVATAQRALDLSAAQNKKNLAEIIQNQLKLFETNAPFHEKP